MSIKKIVTLLFLLTFGAVLFAQQPVVRTEINSVEYTVGDQVTANIIVESNPGLHGLYFDLTYDSNALELIEVEESSIFRNIFEDNELLYAHTSKISPTLAESHLIVSYTLKGKGKLTKTTGSLLKVKFKVLATALTDTDYSFTFNDVGVRDENNNNIPGASWLDSDNFRIVSPHAGSYLYFKSPYGNQTFNTDKADIDLISTKGNFYVKISNLDNPSADSTTDIVNGALIGYKIALSPGYNRLKAALYEKGISNAPLLAEDNVTIYKSPDSSFIKIRKPLSHELLNSDRVSVEVLSSFSNVKVNGDSAYLLEDLTGDNAVYKKDIWLKEGFNTITAVAIDSTTDMNGKVQEFRYTDEVQLYYKKDTTLFKFINPLSDENYKSSSTSTLEIAGEIGSMYKEKQSTNSYEPEKNVVTLKATFYPSNPAKAPTELFKEEEQTAIIEEGSYFHNGYTPTARYFFKSRKLLDFNGLENGRVELVAYKNKVGASWDNAIHRTIYIDNDRLWIDLVQPNIYTSDIIDSSAKLINFNESKDLSSDGKLFLNEDGAFSLNSSEKSIEVEGLKGVTDMIETPDKTLYAVINSTSRSEMILYRKSLGESSWTRLDSIKGTGLYGYKLVYTNNGILIGASNLFTTTNSGLYLLKDDKELINLDLGEQLDHIQFVENRNGRIYLYGNYYQHLYSFNIYSVESVGNRLKVMDMSKVALSNSYNIKQFILTNDESTAIIVTDEAVNNVLFYRRSASGFIRQIIPLTRENSEISGDYVVAGEYENGDYITYLVVGKNNKAEIIMENRATGIFLRNNMADLSDEVKWLGGSLESVGFSNNRFVFLYKGLSSYLIKRGQIFFDKFYKEGGGAEEYTIAQNIDLTTNYRMALTSEGYFYTGIGQLDSSKSLYYVQKKFSAQGNGEFNYFNEDLDEISGFSFEVPSHWLDRTGAIEFGFGQMKENRDAAGTPVTREAYNKDSIQLKSDLHSILNSTATDRFYKVSRTYNVENDRELITVTFNNVSENASDKVAYLNFKLGLKAVGGTSPEVYNLTIYKKIKAKIARPDGPNITLPIHGYIYDKTIDKFTINSEPVNLGRDGSFYHNFISSSELKSIDVELYAINKVNEEAKLRFSIEVIDSKSGVKKVMYKTKPADIYTDLTADLANSNAAHVIDTNDETFYLKGEYFGLVGLITGYEIYSTKTGNLLKSGRFETQKDKTLLNTYLGKEEPGYEAGRFVDQAINLAAGEQRLVIFSENPGGSRDEFKINGLHPIINYNMSESDQKIIFNIDGSTDITEGANTVRVPYIEMVNYETGKGPYQFIGNYDISGEVKSLYKFSDLIVKSYTEGLTFSNGKSEILVNVDEANKFKFSIQTLVDANKYKKDFVLEVIPTIPFLSHLKEKILITSRKSYERSEFIPDFSPINPSYWTEKEKQQLDIPILFSLNRDDFPVSGKVTMTLKANFEHDIIGEVAEFKDITFARLVKLPAGVKYYYLKDELGNPLSLTAKELKEGVNRLAWKLKFNYEEIAKGLIINEDMSSSYSGRTGMEDYIFSYSENSVIAPTVVTMSENLQGIYYSASNLPKLNILKDASTKIKVLLNGKLIKEDDGGKTVTSMNGISLAVAVAREGKNSLVVTIEEKGKALYDKQFIFLYDTKAPLVNIESTLVNEDFTMLRELTAIVNEANYAKAYLHHGNRIINLEPVMEILGEEQYRLSWNSLEPFSMDQVSPTKVEIRDLAGKSSFAELTKFENITRPGKKNVVEKESLLPVYDYKKAPLLKGPEENSFNRITKFAPNEFPAYTSINRILNNNGDKLVNFFEDRGPVYWSKMESLENVYISPEVYDKNNSPHLTSQVRFTTTAGKYGTGVDFWPPTSNSTAQNIEFYPFGKDYNPTSKQYTFSFYYKTANDAELRRGDMELFFDDTSGIIFRYTGSSTNLVRVNAVDEVGKATSFRSSTFKHVYVLLDETNGLSGGKSVRVFVDGEEIVSSTKPITINKMYLKFHTFTTSGSSYHNYMDNLKIWDYIVAENPDWEKNTSDPENAVTPTSITDPIYYTKCETVEELTKPILSKTGTTPSTTGTWSIKDLGAGNMASFYLAGANGGAKIYPFGTGVHNFNKLAISLDALVDSRGYGSLAIKAGNFNFTIVDHGSASTPYSSMSYVVEGNPASQSVSYEKNTIKNFYILLDSSQSLDNNTATIKIFQNDIEILSGSEPINLNGEILFEAGHYGPQAVEYAQVALDNIKIWDTIVAEKPTDLYNNSSDSTEFKPTYHTSLDSLEKITLSEVRDENSIPTTATVGEPVTTNFIAGSKGQAIETYIESIYGSGRNDQKREGSRVIKPLGDTLNDWNKGNLRTFVNLKTDRILNDSTGWWVTSWVNLIGDTSSPFYVSIYNDDMSANTYLVAYINNKAIGTVSIGSPDQWKDVFIAWDKSGLSDGSTLIVYIDGHKKLSTTEPLPDLTSYTLVSEMRVKAHAYYSAPNGQNVECRSWSRMDDLKVWNRVVAENPMALDSAGNVFDIFSSNYKYLMFKLPKDKHGLTHNPANKTEINSTTGIIFKTVGHIWKSDTGTTAEHVIDTGFVDSTDLSRAVDGGDYLYYFIDIESNATNSLRNAFELSKDPAKLFKLLNGQLNNDIIVNPGTLLIDYKDSWGLDFQPADVRLVGKKGDTNLNFNDLIVYDQNYEDPLTRGTMESVKLKSELDYPKYSSTDGAVDRTVTRDSSAEQMTLSFWFRADDEYINDSEQAYDGNIHRILTFKKKDGSNLFKLIYKGQTFNIVDGDGQTASSLLPNNGAAVPVSIDSLGNGKNIWEWNMLTLFIDRTAGTIKFLINDKETKTVTLTNVNSTMIDTILDSDGSFYFGRDDSELSRTGFFSLANPFYIDRILSTNEIARLYSLSVNQSGTKKKYEFNNYSDFSKKPGELRLTTDLSTDYLDFNENTNYSVENCAALKASSEQRNYLTRAAASSHVIFDKAKSPITYDMKILDNSATSNIFTLMPTGMIGRYYFGDKNSNYGLKQNRWYTVTGEVTTMSDTVNAELVLRINGDEQRLKLQQGKFQFIYDNSTNSVPANVKLYIESDGKLTMSSVMSINEGNYTVPVSLMKSAVKSNFIFDLSGTISFWYKPLNANAEGFVNSKAVLFDSELLKIGTTLVNGDAVYYADIKGSSSGTVWHQMITNVKVDYKWQHLQFSYSCDNRVFYLYIDGKIAAKYESTNMFTPFGTLNGNYDGKDNIFIGSSMDGQIFAEGYIDDFYINKYYEGSRYAEEAVSIAPVQVNYNHDDPLKLSIDMTGDSTLTSKISDKRFRLKPIDSYIFDETTDLPLDISAKKAGRYSIVSTMKVNGYNFKDIKLFNIDEKPKFDFIQAESTPVVFQGHKSDIKFAFRFDDSYRFESDKLIYSGIAAQISYNGGVKKQTRYIVQDYISQNSSSWLIGDVSSDNTTIVWKPLDKDNGGQLLLKFKDVTTDSNIDYDFRYFYFTNSNSAIAAKKFDSLPAAAAEDKNSRGFIPKATISAIEPVKLNNQEYKLRIAMSKNGEANNSSIFNNISIEYLIKDMSTDIVVRKGEKPIGPDGVAELYYDDVLPKFGQYGGKIKLKYKGVDYITSDIDPWMNWEIDKSANSQDLFKDKSELTIDSFNLLYIDKSDMASFYLMYSTNGINNQIDGKIEVVKEGKVVYSSDNVEKIRLQPTAGTSTNSEIFNNIPVGKGDSVVNLYLRTGGHAPEDKITISNRAGAPELSLTNWVDSLISYNNVYFSWKGYSEGSYNSNIKYSYDFDNSGWTTFNNSWREVRFYNLEEGPHSFRVKAKYNGVESYVRAVNFFVDINKPQFDSSKIKVENLYDNDGILYAVNIVGAKYAIKDASLQTLAINDEYIDVNKDGSFKVEAVPVTFDGMNKLTLTAYDKVGNYSDYTLTVDNTITEIIYPGLENVKYCPLTIVGRIDEKINTGMDIYLFDTSSEQRGPGDYSGWKKAKINEDRTFFIEDVYINPGSFEREIATTLKMAVVFKSGRTFTRDYIVKANQILMPIELTLSTHAVEGEGKETTVKIEAQANISNISSWSIDFNGDGIYDDVYTVSSIGDPAAKYDPLKGTYPKKSWNYTYSSLGIVSPRVRVITKEGNFFSVSDSLIIHEKIREASNKMITNGISLTAVPMADNSKRIFVLKGTTGQYEIEVYKIARNDAFISNKLFTIGVTGNGINNPVVLRALDSENLFIAENHELTGTVYQLKANEFGNYEVIKTLNRDDRIKDLTISNNKLYISYENRTFLNEVTIGDVKEFDDKNNLISITPKAMDKSKIKDITLVTPDQGSLKGGSAIAADGMGVLVLDWYNQRVVRMTDEGTMSNYFGSLGLGEKQFVKPVIIKSYENRIFVYDRDRMDIQVFDLNYKPITTLKYDHTVDPVTGYNYVEADFFSDITDMEIVTKDENGLLYYYALVMSKTKGKMALFRMPQWEELRAKVRNNKIVFIQDGEIMTAKPDGSDLAKLLSTDSLPRIEGTLDYPALAPDGKRLVFTSRVKLYNRVADGTAAGNEHAYDNLYVIDIETKKLQKVDLGAINGYEIERPLFNSNGDRLIFSAKKTGAKWQIYVYDLATKKVSKLFNSDENARYPYYSPDDRFVVFTTDYDGDEEVEIIDTENLAMRVSVTSNNVRDSLPVWSALYPFEVINSESNKIESKIAFVSERDFHKGVYYVYLSRNSESDIRVVKYENAADIGNDPDSAAIEVTNNLTEGDYPCFTGDGTKLIFQHFDGTNELLKMADIKANFKESTDKTNIINGHKDFTLTDMKLPQSAVRPAGMKNMIVNFRAEQKRGNEIALNWDRYTDNDIFYIVKFRKNVVGEPIVEKKVFAQDGITLKGLTMDVAYLVQVVVRENGEEVAMTQWKKVKMPKVVAIPSFEIDSVNPYLVRLKGWKPEPDTKWRYKWLIDNMEINAEYSENYLYEFGTSGAKTIVLKTSDSGNQVNAISEPMEIEIVSDIEPVIEYVLAEDSSYIELSAVNSKGKKIDFASATWSISGPGRDPMMLQGSKVIAQLNNFTRKINVNLALRRVQVNNQAATDTIQKSMVIDLDLKEVIPVVTYEVDQKDKRLLKFSGEQSKGNIDWYRTKWILYADGAPIYNVDGVSTFAYHFPETNSNKVYTVSLTVPRRNDGQTQTVSQIVSVDAAPILPKIDYEIMEIKQGNNIIGAKLLLDCTKSTGSSIDFNQARWSVPVAGGYGEQPTQFGPTAIYNLMSVSEGMVVEVALTLNRRNGAEPITVTQLVTLSKDELPEAKIHINREITENSSGKTVTLDILKSTGPNIEWEKTDWVIDGQPYSGKGPVAKIEIPASAEKTTLNYSCTLYRAGAAPEKMSGQVSLKGVKIRPNITYRRLSASQKNVYQLSVLDTDGQNIDWERTEWFIFDGNENVNQKRGAVISHSFVMSEKQMGYPIMVTMYLKGSSKPFVKYKNIDIDGDEIIPIIKYTQDESDPNTFTFSATSSTGSGIDWSQVKWTFGDSSQAQYGATVNHSYPINSKSESYKVSLTLIRRSTNGSNEVKTAYKDINIKQDKLQAVITVKAVEGDYMVLSAEDSKGRNLLLDRATWHFKGAGDSFSYNTNEQRGDIVRETHTGSVTVGVRGGWSNGSEPGFFLEGTTTGGYSYTHDATSYEDYVQNSKSFSSSNSHTGAICRRYLRDINNSFTNTVTVTLFVYRMNADGSTEGESITANIKVAEVAAKPGTQY